jgi:hypothetical protein
MLHLLWLLKSQGSKDTFEGLCKYGGGLRKAVLLGWGETESINTMITTEPLYQPRTATMMIDDHGTIHGMRIGGKVEVLWENGHQRHFYPQKSHMAWYGMELRSPRWNVGD